MATQTLYPDAVTSSTNYSTLNATDLDTPGWTSAANDDGVYGANAGGNANTQAVVSFPDTAGPPTVGAGLQTFRALIRKSGGSNNAGWQLQVHEAGTPVATIASGTLTSTAETVISGTWNFSAITTGDQSAVRLAVIQTSGGSGGSPGNRAWVEIGEAAWDVTYTGNVNVAASPASTAADAPAASLVAGAATVAAGASSLEADAPNASLAPGAANTQAASASTEADAPTASAVPGAVAVAAAVATAEFDAPAASLSSATALAATPASVEADAPAATLVAGDLAVAAAPASATLDAPAAALLGESTPVAASPATFASDAPAATLSAGAAATTAAPAEATLDAPAASLQAGALSLAAATAEATLDAPPATLATEDLVAASPAAAQLDAPSAQLEPGVAAIAAAPASVEFDAPAATAAASGVAVAAVAATVELDAPSAALVAVIFQEGIEPVRAWGPSRLVQSEGARRSIRARPRTGEEVEPAVPFTPLVRMRARGPRRDPQ